MTSFNHKGYFIVSFLEFLFAYIFRKRSSLSERTYIPLQTPPVQVNFFLCVINNFCRSLNLHEIFCTSFQPPFMIITTTIRDNAGINIFINENIGKVNYLVIIAQPVCNYLNYFSPFRSCILFLL